jgi:G3E family GTPase
LVQRNRIPILLLTGFLGSGKTSLLSKWLRAPEFAGSMVIVNELGAVGLDDRLVQFSSEAPVLLENGCACCEAAEDLNATLERLFWQRLHRQIPRFEWMLIETTGLADPAPIIAAIGRNDLVAERYRLAGVVTTFDAVRGPEQLREHPECRSQLLHADAIILTKADLANPAEIAESKAAIATIRPDASLLESLNASLPASLVAQALSASGDRQRDVAATAADHSVDVTTAFAALPAPVEMSALESSLDAILSRYGRQILRLKGIVHVSGEAAPVVIQASPGMPVERQTLPAGTAAGKTGFTVIAQFVPAEFVARDLLSMQSQIPQIEPANLFPAKARV